MNGRQKEKYKKALIQMNLVLATLELDQKMFPRKGRQAAYKVHIRRIPFHDSVTVFHKNNIKIEVRESEKNHFRPHFHVFVRQYGEVSIALDNFDVLAGELDRRYLKQVLSWAKENKELLIETWKTFHGSVVQVA